MPEHPCSAYSNACSYAHTAHCDTHAWTAYLHAAPALSHSDAYADCNGYPYADSNPNGYGNASPHADADSDRDAASDANAYYRAR